MTDEPTTLCRQCRTFVPMTRAVAGTYRDADGTCLCFECVEPAE